ncbi:MAG TPA: polyphenol oxidase family protein [Oligoflexia bacterium]|nr:polyphenol oxidase family protein [Oligoflexia bacterium]
MRSNILLSDHFFGEENAPLSNGYFRLHQVHSAEVIEVTVDSAEESTRTCKADALISRARPVAVQTGDCLPVLFEASLGSGNKKIAAASHAGWRGLRAGILKNTLNKMIALGATDIRAAIGPAIGPCCFEVDQSTFDLFAEQPLNAPFLYERQPATSRGHASLQAKPSTNNRWIDLAGIAHAQLVNLGIAPSQVDLIAVCTYCSGLKLASYRRATHQGYKAGRQWSGIAP